MKLSEFYIALVASGSLTFGSLQAQSNVFPANGNVGVGTGSPTHLFEVWGGGIVSSVPSGPSWGFGIQTQSGWGGWARQYSFFSSDGTQLGALMASGDAGNSINQISIGRGYNGAGQAGPEWLTVRSNGNVGVGTSSPQVKLNVQADNAALWNYGQLLISGSSNDNKRLSVGFDTTNNIGFVQPHIAGVDSYPLVLMPYSGNVGVGVTTPGTKLEVAGSFRSTTNGPLPNYGTGMEVFFQPSPQLGVVQAVDRGAGAQLPVRVGPSTHFTPSGDVGLGTPAPNQKLSVNGNFSLGTIGSFIMMGQDAYTGGGGFLMLRSSGSYGKDFSIENYSHATGWQNNLFVAGESGNVGIGTTNPTQKLSVKGSIRAKEVIVETTGWADYVFDEHYDLRPLSEIEQHVKMHKHLPGIPSAAEVAEKGLGLGEMQAKLLAKIEELTLHVIAQEKRIELQNQRIAQQADQISKLQSAAAIQDQPPR